MRLMLLQQSISVTCALLASNCCDAGEVEFEMCVTFF